MSKIKLHKEEKEILEYINQGAYKKLSNRKKQDILNKLQLAASDTATARKSVTLRLPVNVLEKIKDKAAKEGLPYQTFIGSILYKEVA